MRIPPERPPDGNGHWAALCAFAVAVLLVADFLIYVVSSYGSRKVGPNGFAELKGLMNFAPPKPVYRHHAKPTFAVTAVPVSNEKSRPIRRRQGRFSRSRRRARFDCTSGARRTACVERAPDERRKQRLASVPQAASVPSVVPASQAQSPPRAEPVRVVGSIAVEPPVEQP